MYKFNMAAWFEDTYGFSKDTVNDFNQYEQLGYVVNDDSSVYLHFDGRVIPYHESKRYVVEYHPRNGDKWSFDEKAALMKHFAEFVRARSDVHGRTEKSIVCMIQKISTIV